MKVLKIIGGLIGLILAVFLIGAIFVPKELKYEKTIVINKPIGEVWPHTGSLVAMDLWSPWKDHDPNMKQTFGGTPGTVGETSSWEEVTPNTVGKGGQTIVKVEAPSVLETKLVFEKPDEMESTGYVHLAEQDGGTAVTWGFKSDIPYPFNFFVVMMDMEGEMGEDWSLGLSRLKSLAENGKIVP